MERLDLSNNQLREIPEAFCCLIALKHLDLSDCSQLTSNCFCFFFLKLIFLNFISTALPNNIHQLIHLETLLLARTPRLATLPPTFALLPSLTVF